MYKINESLDKIVKGKVFVKQGDKLLWEKDNLICNEFPTFLVKRGLGQKDIEFTHIYGQFGDAANFPIGGGPYVVPAKDDTIADLTSVTIDVEKAPIIYKFEDTQEGQSDYTANVLTLIAYMSQNNTKVYIGAGLVCKTASNELLLAHVGFPTSILQTLPTNITIGWSLLFTV